MLLYSHDRILKHEKSFLFSNNHMWLYNSGRRTGSTVILCNYRPQTKFAMVMFLHVSVILSTGGVPAQGGTGRYNPPPQACTPHPPGRYTPPPQAGKPHPPGRYTPPPRQVHPPGRYTPWPQCMLGNGQQAGSTHSTGMHPCLYIRIHPTNGNSDYINLLVLL